MTLVANQDVSGTLDGKPFAYTEGEVVGPDHEAFLSRRGKTKKKQPTRKKEIK